MYKFWWEAGENGPFYSAMLQTPSKMVAETPFFAVFQGKRVNESSENTCEEAIMDLDNFAVNIDSESCGRIKFMDL